MILKMMRISPPKFPVGLNLSKGGLIAVFAALFLALMILNNELLRGIRLDLTSNKLYTLSEGTRNILGQIQEPINIYLFFSEKETRDLPQIRNYHTRVKEVLEEYSLIAGGKLKLHHVNPEAFSEEEDRATQMGLQAVSTRVGDKIYFGIAGTNTLDTVEVIPFLQTSREAFLEYDLGKLIYNLVNVKKPVLGLMSKLPMDTPKGLSAKLPGISEPWFIADQLRQVFDVHRVQPDVAVVPHEIEVLMVVHPKELPEKTVYAIDQFVMRGGKGLFFVDPQAEADRAVDPNTLLMEPKSKGSDLNRLFSVWGFSVDADSIIGDAARGLTVSYGKEEAAQAHPAVLGLRKEDFNREDVVTDALETLNFYTASYIQAEEDAATKLTPLVWTTRQAMPISIQLFRYMPRVNDLYKTFAPTGERYPLAARIQGAFKSAFDGPPPPEKPEEKNDEEKAEPEPPPKFDPHVAETTKPGVMVVVADVDLLTDRMWAQKRNFFGRVILQPFANNRDFIINLADNLFGSADLINIRSRASYSRPFTRVLEIETAASQKYRATEQSLQTKLKETEAKLQELQQQRDDQKSTLLTASQQEEVRKFQKKKVEISKKLRNVRHQLVKDIENLGTRLKLANIIVMPLIVVVASLVVGFVRVRRHKQSAAI